MTNLYIFNENRAVYGVSTYICELIEILRDSHINVCMVHLFSGKYQICSEKIDGINYLYLPAPISKRQRIDQNRQNELYYCNVVYFLQFYIKGKRNLIFHLNYNQSGKLAEELKKKFHCRVVSVVHGLIWCSILSGNIARFRNILAHEGSNLQKDESKTAVIEWYRKEKELFEMVDNIICLSENTRLILQDDYKIKPDKITVIYNGLSDNNADMDQQILRKKYHVPDVPVILFAGRLDDKKGLIYALRAFKVLLATLPNCHFIIAGNGSFDIHMKECKDIWLHVTWTGLIDKKALYDLYSIADISVFPSFTEQCSYAAIEMMMHGLPMITTSAPGLAEMTEDGISSLQVPVMEYPDRVKIDTELLAEKMLYLLQHPEERKQMGINSRKCYEQLYSLEIMREKMLDFYQSLFKV